MSFRSIDYSESSDLISFLSRIFAPINKRRQIKLLWPLVYAFLMRNKLQEVWWWCGIDEMWMLQILGG